MAIVAGTAALAALLLSWALTTGGGDFAHVFDLLWAKLRFFGVRPADPALLSFGARIMSLPTHPTRPTYFVKNASLATIDPISRSNR